MNVASLIDHTILKSDCTPDDIERLCNEAIQYQFASVCIPPYYVKKAHKLLAKSNVKVATVIGFPMGYTYTPAKVEEVKRAMSDGADELDVVVNVAAIKNDEWRYVENDIDSVTTASHLRGKIVKIIFEVDLLTAQEISKLCSICTKIGVDYVKTSTGFVGNGASVAIIESLRQQLPEKIKIKASGGIRSAEAAQQLILAGAKRLGTSRSVEIVENSWFEKNGTSSIFNLSLVIVRQYIMATNEPTNFTYQMITPTVKNENIYLIIEISDFTFLP